MNRREMKLLLEERFERIALLETRIDTMEQLIDGYHAREQSIIDTLHAAQNTAEKLVEQARAEAEEIRELARSAGEAQLSETRDEAQAALQQAQQRAQEMRISAKTESDRMLRDAEIIKREYEEMIASFNAMLEQNASELRQTAARFAEYVRGRKIEASEVRLDGEAFYKSVGAMNEAQLPDPSGDPAALMKNIYLLQKRPLPDAQDSAAEESGAESEPAASEPPEEQQQTEPFSEQAWVNAQQQSKREPQAEFTPAFDTAFVPSNFEVRSTECAASSGEAEHAFDEYFSEQGFTGAQGGQKAAPEPYTQAAWTNVNTERAGEPQAEAEQAFDEFYQDALEPSGKTAEDEVAPEKAEGPEGAAPEPYSEKAWAQGAFMSSHEPQAEGALAFDALIAEQEPTSYEGVKIEETPAPAQEPVSYEGVKIEETTVPYSEKAWAQGAFTSDHEPQAEGAAAFDAAFEEDPEDETVKHPFDAELETREWEPEHEPETDEIPTVSRYVTQNGEEEDVSLDALLDEIIKAGE